MEKVAEEKITPEEADVRMLLSCQAHLGCKAITMHMTPYVHGRNESGVYIINPKLTLEKLRLAARIICGIENPADVCVVSGRTYGQRAVLKFAHYTGCTALATRFTPGTFTNQIQKRYLEPRLLLVTDPITDHQPIVESSYVNIPVIAICDTDSPLKYVDVAIPANNKGKHQIGIIYWMLAREVLRIRGELPYKKAWDVMPDLFFYRETVERQKKEEEEAAEVEETVFLESGRGGRSTGQQMPDEERDYMARSERGDVSAAPPAAAVSWAGTTEPAAGESWADASGGAAAGAGGGWGGEAF